MVRRSRGRMQRRTMEDRQHGGIHGDGGAECAT